MVAALVGAAAVAAMALASLRSSHQPCPSPLWWLVDSADRGEIEA